MSCEDSGTAEQRKLDERKLEWRHWAVEVGLRRRAGFPQVELPLVELP